MNTVDCILYPNIKKQITMVKFRYSIFEYKPYEYARISVMFLDETDTPVDNAIYTLDTSNGFLEWGNDDKYIETWLRAKWNTL